MKVEISENEKDAYIENLRSENFNLSVDNLYLKTERNVFIVLSASFAAAAVYLAWGSL